VTGSNKYLFGMLHIHPGDSSANSLRSSGITDPVIVWADTLWEGPAPLDVPQEQWIALRADYLVKATGGAFTLEQLIGHLTKQENNLELSREHEETVLWFDACMYDQLIMIKLLDWFARNRAGTTELSMICIGSYPDIERFHGLGELQPMQLAGLLRQRQPVTEEQFAVATNAWKAVRSPDPLDIQNLLQTDLSSMPYLSSALARLLQQYPSGRNGLSRLELETVVSVAAGNNRLGPLFAAVSDQEEVPFFGDTSLWAVVNDLAQKPEPALKIDGPGLLPVWEPLAISRWSVATTPFAAKLLDGTANWIAANGIDRWVGGVHLQKTNLWYYDTAAAKLFRK
jgi:hypothetical protein